MVRHRPVLNLLRWAHRAFAFNPADRVLFVTSLSFDLSVFDFFGPWASGGAAVVPAPSEAREPAGDRGADAARGARDEGRPSSQRRVSHRQRAVA